MPRLTNWRCERHHRGALSCARVFDAIGRKNALLVCLGGALTGDAIALTSLYVNSLWLLILGRAVTGFAAGNQPIAQAAMVDTSILQPALSRARHVRGHLS